MNSATIVAFIASIDPVYPLGGNDDADASRATSPGSAATFTPGR
ncbi:hypothetical protein [Rhodococcus jostii]